MTLTQLRIFIAVAEYGNVTKAAQEIGITQSAASAAIASIENVYQVKLFNRVGRAIILSEVGKRFLPEAQGAIERAKGATRALRLLSEQTSGKISIAASQTIASYWLPKRLAAFNEQNPGVTVNVSMLNTLSVKNALSTGKADIGFVEGDVNTEGLKLIDVDQDQPTLVISPKKWATTRPLANVKKLTKLPWIVRENGSGTRRILEDLISHNGFSWQDLDIILELPSNEAIREAVIAGCGVTVISQHVVSLSIESGLLKSVNLNIPPRNYRMVFQKNRSLSSAEEAFIKMITPNNTSQSQ